MLLFYVCILALFLAAYSKKSNDPKECKNYRLGTLGFTARFYTYELGSTMGWGRNFFKEGYRTSLIATVSGIRNINFNFPKHRHMVVYHNSLYGYKLTTSNYTVELSGFFSVPQSGIYTFNLAADDGASLNVGAGENCCSDAARSVNKFPDIKPISPKAGKGSISTNLEKRDYDLTAGLYYPIKIVVFNWNGAGAIDFFVTDPNKRTVRKFGSLVRGLKFKDSACYVTVTSAWDQPHSITTTQVSKPDIDILTVYVRVPKKARKLTRLGTERATIRQIHSGPLTETEDLKIPKPEEVTHIAWIKDSTSTSTDLSPHLFNRVYIFVPKHFVTTTRTWDQPGTSESTEHGDLTDHVVINVPKPTRHVTVAWTNDFTSTQTAYGGPGETNLVIVKVPKVIVKNVKTWTGASISESTEHGDLTDHVVINVPKPTRHVTVAWKNDFTSTQTAYGGPGETNLVIVKVLKVIVKNVKTWTGASISESTEHGDLTDHVVINVPKPTRHVTVAWKNDFTSTQTAYGGPGETNLVIVKVPKVIVKNVKTWTGASISETTEHGDLTDHVVINVPKPTRHVTVAWKNDFTSTQTAYGGPGETNLVIVKVPKVIVKNVKTWTGASISESTEHGDLTDHVVINVPKPTRHVTVAWKNDFTSTQTAYGGPGETNLVIVKVPKVIVKNVKTWTGASISETTEHGDLTDHVVINVPKPTRHVTVAWKNDFTSTQTAYGGPGETNLVIVKVPKVIVKNVKTWTGASISESTEHGDLTDHVVINVPKPTRHVTVAWKYDFTSTQTAYGGPGETNLVIVKVPKVIVKNVKTWTGASISESTEHGDLTDHVVINVPKPTRHVTVAWKNDFTSTQTAYGGPGETNLVIVKVPKVIVKNVKTWTGASISESTEHGDLTDHVVINVPKPTRHVTVAWKNDFTSTQTAYGGPGETNLVIVKVPKVIVKNVKTWTGASISETTEHGDLTDHVVINVPKPTRHVTVAWKNDFTSTQTAYGGPGETNLVIVKVPKVIVKNVKTWTGASISESTEHGDLTDHVVINVPKPTRHVTVAWKYDFTSTQTAYGGPGETNLVIVKVPIVISNRQNWKVDEKKVSVILSDGHVEDDRCINCWRSSEDSNSPNFVMPPSTDIEFGVGSGAGVPERNITKSMIRGYQNRSESKFSSEGIDDNKCDANISLLSQKKEHVYNGNLANKVESFLVPSDFDERSSVSKHVSYPEYHAEFMLGGCLVVSEALFASTQVWDSDMKLSVHLSRSILHLKNKNNIHEYNMLEIDYFSLDAYTRNHIPEKIEMISVDEEDVMNTLDVSYQQASPERSNQALPTEVTWRNFLTGSSFSSHDKVTARFVSTSTEHIRFAKSRLGDAAVLKSSLCENRECQISTRTRTCFKFECENEAAAQSFPNGLQSFGSAPRKPSFPSYPNDDSENGRLYPNYLLSEPTKSTTIRSLECRGSSLSFHFLILTIPGFGLIL